MVEHAGEDMESESKLKEVRAVYQSGTLCLLEDLDLPEGTQVRISIETIQPSDTTSQRAKSTAYPTRLVPAERLNALTGLVEAGGDALADSEALYDPDRD
jgi:predicted DNA-binding antitoxin AbrB/MazE fold protein